MQSDVETSLGPSGRVVALLETQAHPLTARTRTWELRAPGTLAVGAWLVAALALTLLFTWRTMWPVFQAQEIVQDDARLHVFWTARLRDPELFPNDLIADYFQAVAPPGYTALYWLLSQFLDPLEASKLLLPPLLGLLTALFAFLLARRLHPSPVGAFLAASLLSWWLWQTPDLVSATPRAFWPPSWRRSSGRWHRTDWLSRSAWSCSRCCPSRLLGRSASGCWRYRASTITPDRCR
jgi:hypothetical protein